MKRYKEIDYLKGMGILFVILCHAVIVYPINLMDSFPFYLIHEFALFICNPLFFLAAGFVFQNRDTYGLYLKKKIQRILIPHLFFGIIELVPRVIPNPLVNKQSDLREAVSDFVLYGGSDWFLTTLFTALVVFPFLYGIFEKGRVGKVFIIILLGLLFLGEGYLTNVFRIRQAILNMPYLLIGCVVRQHYDKVSVLLQKPVVTVAGFFIMIGLFWSVKVGGAPLAVETIGAVGGAVFFYRIACVIKGKVASCLQECGKYTLQMYLLNGYVLVATRTLFVTILGVTQPVCIVLFNFVTMTLLTYGISRYMLQRFKYLRLVSGL